MMSTLPSPPLSPVTSYDRRKRHGYHRHPERRRDTFEILQALITEHQRREQDEFDAMTRDLPIITTSKSHPPTKGILVRPSTSSNSAAIASCSSSASSSSSSSSSSAPAPPLLSPTPGYVCHSHDDLIDTTARATLSTSSTSPTPSAAARPPKASASTPLPPRHSMVRFAPDPPKIFRYPRREQLN
ncbi:hypothetical protein BC940DRAFT_309640 [Gongronella butleri]|nr:hypothetical protein BC940DRAFT_309640 [Gongronella butleri]